ncbi:MAG: hypothetical protein AB7N73_07040 [Gemmatimonadales bacterium]|nr:hypothetical protein [Gemmatimonadota bacterium]MCA9767931.1 hypothetical protein [Gemmatimonadota bacterium]HRX18902.1 hypothetical protein [Gemmatimonadales bacterium]
MRVFPGVLIALATVAAGCAVANSAAESYTAQTVGAAWGPCGRLRDSVLVVHGEPAKRMYGDEEDVSDKTRVYTQELAWRLPVDSARVVAFTWGDGVRRCQVRERRLKWADWEREI